MNANIFLCGGYARWRVCVRVCVHARVLSCVRARVDVCVRACMRACVNVYVSSPLCWSALEIDGMQMSNMTSDDLGEETSYQ